MRRAAIGLSLAAVVVLLLPAGASTSPAVKATLVLPLPNAGDLSVAEAVVKLRGPKITKALRLTPNVVNAKQLGKDVVVVAAVRQETKDRSRFDVTAAVLRRGVRTTSSVHGEEAPRIGFKSSRSLPKYVIDAILVSISPNAAQGNTVPKLRFDCGFGTSSFLAGKRSALPPAGDTIAYACGFWLDQVWEPQSFATAFAANWCAVPIDPSSTAQYTFHFNCNFPIRGAALEDPLKAATIVNVIPDTGTCGRVNNYTFVCPQEQGTSGTLTASFTAPLDPYFEFGFGTSTDGKKINEFFPSRVIDDPDALEIIAQLSKQYAGDIDREFNDIATFIVAGNNAVACLRLRALYNSYGNTISTQKGGDQGQAAYAALKALDCNTR